MNKFFLEPFGLLALAVLLLVSCSDKHGSDINGGKSGKNTPTTITYQSEPDSPWGSFTMPVKDSTYTIEAPRSQEDETLVLWAVRVINTGESLNVNANNVEYPEGTIRIYNSRRRTFTVSARDSAAYWFTVSNIDWLVKTTILQ